MQPTNEQLDIITAAQSDKSVMVSAMAGVGKTTTLKMVAAQLRGTSLAIAFNKKIATELSESLPNTVVCSTFNALGHRALANVLGRQPKIEEWKFTTLFKQLSSEEEWREFISDYSENNGNFYEDVKELLKQAMLNGLVPKGTKLHARPLMADTMENWQLLVDSTTVDKSCIPFTREILRYSCDIGMGAILGTPPIITFDDQLYLSIVFGGIYKQFDNIMIDEAQDLNKLNFEQIKRSLKPGGRLFVFGDPRQSIYKFRGSVSGSMEQLRSLSPEWIDCTLSTTWRCPKLIVERQQIHAPGYTAAPTNIEGQVDSWKEWNHFSLMDELEKFGEIAILCRNNAPLINLAFKLLGEKIGCQMLGRDIGKMLVKTAENIWMPHGKISSEPLDDLENWKEKQLIKAGKSESKRESVMDRVEALDFILKSCELDVHEVIKCLKEIFSNERSKIILSSIHRAKGMEWKCVLFLDQWRIFRNIEKSTDPEDILQEKNLNYVAETRAKVKLILADFHFYSGE